MNTLQKSIKCPQCKVIIKDTQVLRCPRCNCLVITPGCTGSCTKCNEKNKCGC